MKQIAAGNLEVIVNTGVTARSTADLFVAGVYTFARIFEKLLDGLRISVFGL